MGGREIDLERLDRCIAALRDDAAQVMDRIDRLEAERWEAHGTLRILRSEIERLEEIALAAAPGEKWRDQ